MRALQFINVKHSSEELINFLRFTCEYLEIDSIPKIKLLDKPIRSSDANSFAAFQPSSNTIILYTKNRHILDVMRSLAHEMVHYKQSMTGRELDGSTGSTDENEANAVAGQIMRLYGKKHPKLY
jgi:hypothetical protein